MAPRIGRPSGFLPRLPSRLPPPSSVHDGVSLLRQVLLWLPPPSCGICGTPFPQQIPPYVSTAGGAGVGVCPFWRRRRVDHGAWAAVGEGVPEVGLSGAPVTATPKRRCRTLVLGGARRGPLRRLERNLQSTPLRECRRDGGRSGSSAGVFALLPCACPSFGARYRRTYCGNRPRCPDGSRHGQTGGVAWRRGGVYDSLPQHRRAALMSFSPLRAPAAASPTSGQVDTTPDHRGFDYPREDVPAWQGLLVEGGKAAECSWVSLPAWWWGSGVDVVDAPRPQGASHRGRAHVECPVQVAETGGCVGRALMWCSCSGTREVQPWRRSSVSPPARCRSSAGHRARIAPAAPLVFRLHAAVWRDYTAR